MPLTLADTLASWRPTPRQQLLDSMLARYLDAQEVIFSTNGAKGGDMAGVLQMPKVWTDSYRMLERLLRLFRTYANTDANRVLERDGFARSAYWHLAEFYLRRQTRMAKGCRGCGKVELRERTHTHEGQRFSTDEPILHITRHTEIRLEEVAGGVEWIDLAWSPRARVQPDVPRAMTEELVSGATAA